MRLHEYFQRQSVLGNQIEMDIMLSVEDNDSLLRVGVSLQSMEARNRVGEALERNYERRRNFPIILLLTSKYFYFSAVEAFGR